MSDSNAPGVNMEVPLVDIVYRDNPQSGLREIVGTVIAGKQFAGVFAVRTSFDLLAPVGLVKDREGKLVPSMPRETVRLSLDTVWPFRWVELSQAQGPEIVVATKAPPEPPSSRLRPVH